MDSIQASSNYLRNFDFSRAFWKPTNGAQTMHVFCTQGRDGARGVAQLWVTGRIEYATLHTDQEVSYLYFKDLCITDDDRSRMKTGFKRYGNLGDRFTLATSKQR